MHQADGAGPSGDASKPQDSKKRGREVGEAGEQEVMEFILCYLPYGIVKNARLEKPN
jgi:hypothetical protein